MRSLYFATVVTAAAIGLDDGTLEARAVPKPKLARPGRPPSDSTSGSSVSGGGAAVVGSTVLAGSATGSILGATCPCSHNNVLFTSYNDASGAKVSGGPFWKDPKTMIPRPVAGILSDTLNAGQTTIEIKRLPVTTRHPDLTDATVNQSKKKFRGSGKKRQCHQALAEYARDFNCSTFQSEVEDNCIEAIKDFAVNGDVNGMFSETPELAGTKCTGCKDGINTCTCDLKAWRFRDWEVEPVKLLDWDYVDWMGGGEKVNCRP